MLCEDGHCAGIERNLLLQGSAELRGQNHIAHADGRRDRAREGVHVDDAFFRFKREKRILGFCGHGELGVKIVLNNKSVLRRRPANVAGPPRRRRGDPARIAVEWRDVKDRRVGLFQRTEPDAFAVHRQHPTAHAAGFVDKLDLLVRRILQRENPLTPQHLHDQVVQIFRT